MRAMFIIKVYHQYHYRIDWCSSLMASIEVVGRVGDANYGVRCMLQSL